MQPDPHPAERAMTLIEQARELGSPADVLQDELQEVAEEAIRAGAFDYGLNYDGEDTAKLTEWTWAGVTMDRSAALIFPGLDVVERIEGEKARRLAADTAARAA